ncbi:MAG: methylenetetrahydrofolate--tRNA-(uracil(54)-C(5))-methyltransferase (FADH(2)-oxidizing) TrmFO, partial [Enterococcus sp.]|nr:methylenetetrahydrofolate--tRNA-(uracil(54)-C(5))-methyltransferase (FADH(2)-oxidizing) TrmFO [Enterococcus sp.]
CSNSLKSLNEASAQGMLKYELEVLNSHIYKIAKKNAVPAGGALAVDRDAFSADVLREIENHPHIKLIREEIRSVDEALDNCDACIFATGPLTSDSLGKSLSSFLGEEELSFYDAVAPIVMADSLNMEKLFVQGRYDKNSDMSSEGDYLNAPFSREEYETFIDELVSAKKVILKDFENKELFQACQPIEEIARKGMDAPRFGPLKPVGLTNPKTKKRPWAVLQLRAENKNKTCYNLVGFQTNLTFSEQLRVFRLIPGLEDAVFSRYGVMHRNTFINAPQLLNRDLSLRVNSLSKISRKLPIFFSGQLSGTEGYVEAIRSGLHAAISCLAKMKDIEIDAPSTKTVFGSLLQYATSPDTQNYQPMHVNFGIIEPLPEPVRNKKDRYAKYAERAKIEIQDYKYFLKISSVY